MKKFTNNRKIAGFSMVDTLLAVGVMGVIAPVFIQAYLHDKLKKQAVEYADQTKTYAKAFARVITDNYSTYHKAAAASPGLTQVIRGSQLQSSGYLPAGVSYKNIYRQIPCVSIRLNSSNNQLEAMMFYVLPSGIPNKLTNIQGKSTMLAFGGEAGMVNDDTSVSGANWNLPGSSPFFTASGNCDAGTIPKFSVAVNLAMLPEYSSNLQDDPTLHRNQDNVSGTTGGDQNNLNTMQTDITMQTKNTAGVYNKPSGIFMTGNANAPTNAVFIGSGRSAQMANLAPGASYSSSPNTVVLQNGDFKASTLQPNKTATPFTPCKYDSNKPNDPGANEIGQIITDSLGNIYQRQQLICTYNPTYCSGSSSKSCYLPINPVTLQFHPNATSFDCEAAAGDGYYIQPGSPQLTGNSIDPLGSENASCGQKYDPINYHSTQNSNNGFDVAISPDRYVQNVGCYFGGCCSWHKTQTFTITSIACTNDTSTFINVN